MSKFLPCADASVYEQKRLDIEMEVGIPNAQSNTLRLSQAFKDGSDAYLIEIPDQYWTLAQNVLSATEISSVVTSPTGYTPQTIDANEVVRTVENLLVCDGDSITYGGTAGLQYYRYPDQLGRMLDITPAYWKILNFGVSGQTLAQMQSDASTQIDPYLSDGATGCKRILLAWGGINDLAYSNVATAKSNWDTYMSARLSAGWTILPFTTSYVSPSHATITESMVTEFNAYVRDNYEQYSPYLADIASLPEFGSASVVDGSAYYADIVHPNALGYGVIATYLSGIVSTMLAS